MPGSTCNLSLLWKVGVATLLRSLEQPSIFRVDSTLKLGVKVLWDWHLGSWSSRVKNTPFQSRFYSKKVLWDWLQRKLFTNNMETQSLTNKPVVTRYRSLLGQLSMDVAEGLKIFANEVKGCMLSCNRGNNSLEALLWIRRRSRISRAGLAAFNDR